MADGAQKPVQDETVWSGTLSVGSGFSLGFVDAPARGDAPLPPVPQQDPGGAFVLRSLIAAGGQGQVWEAWQTSLRRVVAVKVCRTEGSERFLREALLTGELDHPSIVPVLDLGQLVATGGGDANVAMAMKRLRGVPWDQLIARERPATSAPSTEYLRRHLAIVETVCRAVSYAHSRRVIHLDLKPSQVIVGEYGEVYLCDWGMAARMPDDGGALDFVSPPSGPFGTPGYMAPEQALGDFEALGVATDIYLLGGLVYHVVTGRMPHPGETSAACILAARRNEVPPFGPEIPAVLKRVVCASMAASPAERFADAESFRRAIADAIQEVIQDEEAARLCHEVAARLDAGGELTYAALEELEQKVERAIALAPEAGEGRALRDRTLERHATLALEHGDLALASVMGERIGDPQLRRAILDRRDAAQAALAAREQQRIRARRAAFGALCALVAVLVISSGSLYKAFQRVESEKGRAEGALLESRRELARASLQAAMAYLDKKRPADARGALRHVPAEWRSWEWGYLASMAVPELRLHRPRPEAFEALALSGDAALLGAIRSADGALVIVDRNAGAAPSRELTGRRWTAAGPGPGTTIVAGSQSGEVLRIDAGGIQSIVPCGGRPIELVRALGDDVVAADDDGKLWHLRGGRAEAVFDAGGKVTALETRGDAMALGTADGVVWHGTDPAKLARTTEAHRAPVRGIAWHPSQPWFATWANDPAIRQPLTDSRAIIHAIGRTEPVNVTVEVEFGLTAVAWSPDGKTLSAAYANAWIHQLDVATWKLNASRYHDVGICNGLGYTPDGARLVMISRNLVQVRETQWLGQERVFQTDSRSVAAYALAGNSLVACGADGGIGEWAIDRAAHTDVLSLSPDRVESIDAAAGASVAAAAHQWGAVVMWSLEPAPLKRVGNAWSTQPVAQVRVSSDGGAVVALSRAGHVEFMQRTNGVLAGVRYWDAPGPLNGAAMHPKGRSFVVAPAAGGLLQAETPESEQLTPRAGGLGPFTALDYAPAGDVLFAGQADGTIAILDAKSFSKIRALEGHTATIRRLAVAAEGDWLVSASDDESARLWDVASGQPVAVYRGTQSGPVTSALLTPDRKRVITAGDDSIVRVFDRESAVELVAFQEHQYGVLDMDLSPDGRCLLTSGQDSVLRSWIALPWDGDDSFFESGAGALRAAINPPAAGP